MQLKNSNPQKIKGYFKQNDSSLFEAELVLDRYRLWNSSLSFNELIPHARGNQKTKFTTEYGHELTLVFPSTYISGYNTQVKFDIKEFKIVRSSTDIYIRTGPVEGLTYFPRSLRILDVEFQLKEIDKSKRLGRKPEFYFEASLERLIKEDKINKLLFCLSTLTCCSLWISEFADGEVIILENRKSKKRTIPYMGSGMMHFPLRVKDLERLCRSVKWENLYHFHLHYSNFCTTTDYIYQLYRGCALLDYLISLFKRNLKVSGKNGKTSDLYAILKELDVQKLHIDYLHKVFPHLPYDVDKINDKLEFFELRDDHIHRGGIFLKQEEVRKFQRCIVSLNEIIRILIPHIDKIQDWKFHPKSFYKAISSKEIVDIRQDLINWHL